MTKIDQEQLQKSTGALLHWLETWQTSQGGYSGFVIHRSETKRMRYIHDTAWTQAAMIRGFANLCRKSPQTRWLFRLQQAADLQYSRFDQASGKYQYAGHEDDRFCSLVHCALANCALLDAAQFVDENRRSRYVQTVCINIDNYWIAKLWVENEGAFRFSDTDYYSLHEDRFVINFNTMAAETLLKIHAETGEEKYRDYALRVGEWLIKRCRAAQNHFQTSIDTSASRMRIPAGGLPYQFTPSQPVPDNCVCLYAGLALRGIAELYKFTENGAYYRIARDAIGFLAAMRDSRTGLFFHTTRDSRIERYPQFVAGVGMILAGVDEAARALELECNLDDTLGAILEKQYPNGGFPSFIGKNLSGARNGNGRVWEDVVAGVNWNAQFFEYLTKKIKEPRKIPHVFSKARSAILSKRFLYVDDDKRCLIVSWWPARSMGLYVMTKRADKAFAVYPVQIRNSFRAFLKNRFSGNVADFQSACLKN